MTLVLGKTAIAFLAEDQVDVSLSGHDLRRRPWCLPSRCC